LAARFADRLKIPYVRRRPGSEVGDGTGFDFGFQAPQRLCRMRLRGSQVKLGAAGLKRWRPSMAAVTGRVRVP
jgi:hypothetical protein